ncbi:MAG TPA: MOSC N-terminal beta barrel domain-containing protein, partial [Acidimicrobiia bacterium]
MAGRLLEVHRFPVKSMRGEALTEAQLDDTGVAGDRAHALLDVETGKVASAKDPRRWAALLGFAAAYVDAASSGAQLVVVLPDGSRVRSDEADVDARLSDALGRSVRLVATPAAGAVYDDLWPDVEGIAPEEFIADTQTSTSDDGRPVSSLPVGLLAPGTFQDVAPLTILTSASLARAAALAPNGRWDTRRFRPNLVVDVEGEGFLENEWTGRRIAVGEVVVEVLAATPRCVMTTLPQDDLPA